MIVNLPDPVEARPAEAESPRGPWGHGPALVPLVTSLRDALFRPRAFFGSDKLEQAPVPALVCAAASTCSFLGVARSGALPTGIEIATSPWIWVVFAVSVPLAYLASGALHAATILIQKRRWGYRRALVVFCYSQTPLFLSLIPYLGELAGLVALIWLVVGVRYAYTNWLRSVLLGVGIQLVLGVGVAVGVRTLLVEAFRVPSGAMLPTIEPNDHLFVSKWPWSLGQTTLPDRGDLVVFQYPYEGEPMNFVKRVIALPGEVVEIRQGDLLIDGERIRRCEVGDVVDGPRREPRRVFVEFLGETPHLIQTAVETDQDDVGLARNWGPFTVPDGEVFVMGDNRDASSDSTRWRQGAGGGVPLRLLKGRLLMIWFPTVRFSYFPATTARELTMGLPGLKPSVLRCLTAH